MDYIDGIIEKLTVLSAIK